jgi:hypothetical protein
VRGHVACGEKVWRQSRCQKERAFRRWPAGRGLPAKSQVRQPKRRQRTRFRRRRESGAAVRLPARGVARSPRPAGHPAGGAARPSALDVFIARAEARALLWQAGEFDLHDAVDVLWHAAERDGLVTLLGQDAVQRLMAEAFRKVREDAR